MQAYHHFPINRSATHLLVSFAIIMLPLAGLISFSLVSGIAFSTVIFDLLISMWRLGVAFIVATILAWLLVVLLVRGKTSNPALALFDVLQSLPTFTILPIAVHFYGTSEITIILFLVLTIIWPIIFSIVSSLKQAKTSWGEAVMMSRLTGWSYVRYYLLPVTLPGIVTGAIIGLGDGWEALIATELIIEARSGLGPFFQSFSADTPMTFYGVLVFLLVIFSLNKFIWLPLLEKSHQLLD